MCEGFSSRLNNLSISYLLRSTNADEMAVQRENVSSNKLKTKVSCRKVLFAVDNL